MKIISKLLTAIASLAIPSHGKLDFFKKIILATLLFNSPVQAEIESISAERLTQSSNVSYWQVDVMCVGESRGILIRQRGGESNWCTNGGPVETCESSKESLADKICNTALLSILRPGGQQQPVPVVRQPSVQERKLALLDEQRKRQQQAKTDASQRLLSQQRRLGQERTALNQEKTELRKLEANLNRQLSEIEEQMQQLN